MTYEEWGGAIETKEPPSGTYADVVEMFTDWTADREESLRRGREKDNEIEETVERVEAQLRRAEAAEAELEVWRKNCKECTTIRNALSEVYEADKRAAEAELAKFRQAVGLATTAVPDMVMNADDPIGMMHRVVAERDKLAERVWVLEKRLNPGVHDIDDFYQDDAALEGETGKPWEREMTRGADIRKHEEGYGP